MIAVNAYLHRRDHPSKRQPLLEALLLVSRFIRDNRWAMTTSLAAVGYLAVFALILLSQCTAAAAKQTSLAETAYVAAMKFCDQRRDNYTDKILTRFTQAAKDAGMTTFSEAWIVQYMWCGSTGRNTLFEAVDLLCNVANGYVVLCDPSTARNQSLTVRSEQGDGGQQIWAVAFEVFFHARPPANLPVAPDAPQVPAECDCKAKPAAPVKNGAAVMAKQETNKTTN